LRSRRAEAESASFNRAHLVVRLSQLPPLQPHRRVPADLRGLSRRCRRSAGGGVGDGVGPTSCMEGRPCVAALGREETSPLRRHTKTCMMVLGHETALLGRLHPPRPESFPRRREAHCWPRVTSGSKRA
jgi:hypothetical protein